MHSRTARRRSIFAALPRRAEAALSHVSWRHSGPRRQPTSSGFLASSMRSPAPIPSVESIQDNLAALNELLETILNKQLGVQFQPIIHFAEQRVYGYECLIRVPQTGGMRKPGAFFRTADNARVVAWLNVACQERCFENAARARVRDSLFI